MKKFYESEILKFIRNALVLFLFSVPSLWAFDTSAQSNLNKLNVKSGTVASVFEQIRKQTDLEFFYNASTLDINRRVEIDMEPASLEQILETVLGNRHTYTIRDNYVMIARKKAGQAPASQSRPVAIPGSVKNERGEPIIGATVSIRGTSTGVISDANGHFTLRPASTDNIVIQVTYLGMTPVTITYTGQPRLDIVMKENVSSIDDVVITGYFPIRKEGFAGAVTKITREDLEKVSTPNIFLTINSLDPGFRIIENNNTGSDPNKLPDFTMRGKGSFQKGSTQPLFILDGMEVSAETIFDLDMSRVENITLLKDASATILYGSRASNGVVVIETRVPVAGDARITYTFKPTVSFADLTGYDLMNASEKLEYERQAGLYDPIPGRLLETYERDMEYQIRFKNVLSGVDTYWLSQPVRNAFSHAHSLRVEGGVRELTYAMDVNYDKNSGVMKKSGRDRTGISITLGYRIRNKITVQNRASYGYTHAYDSPYGTFSAYSLMNPYERIYDDDGKLIPLLMDGRANPLYDSRLPNRSFDNTETLSDQLFVDWAIFENLKLRGQLALTKKNMDGDKYTSPFSAYYILSRDYDIKSGQYIYIPADERGALSISNGREVNTSGNLSLTYNTLFADKHLLYASLGGEFSTSRSSSNTYSLMGFINDRFSDPVYAIQYGKTKATSRVAAARAIGVFANLNYIYDNRFFADFSSRVDGASKFGVDNRYAVFWSAGGGWNVHNESFWPQGLKFDQFKLRMSYGVTGNQDFNDYQAKTVYMFMSDRTYWRTMPARLKNYGSPALKWESTRSANAGLDLGLARRRLTLTFDYYVRRTKNSITGITVAPSVGLPGNQYTANLGEISNRGFEFSLNVIPIRNEEAGFEWALLFQGGFNRNKVLKISNMLRTMNDANNGTTLLPGLVFEEGLPLSTIKAVRSLGIDPVSGKEIYVKRDGSLTYDWNASDKVYAGVADPKLYGNVGTNVGYGNWNLNVLFRYSFGADYYNNTLAQRVEGANPVLNADRRVLNDRWKKPGDYSLFTDIKDHSANKVSTRFVQRENMAELSSLSLSYDFERELLKRYGMRMVRLSAYANSLLRMSTIKEERGFDYPFARSFVFELRVTF